MPWTPENQARFEARYGKVESAAPQDPPRPTPDPPKAKTPKPPRRRHYTARWYLVSLFQITIIALIWALGGSALCWLKNDPNLLGIFWWPSGVLVFVWIAVLFVSFVIAIFRFWWRFGKEVSTPLPSLQEIEAKLKAEGYPNPSLQDVLAVDQYLRRNRNETLAAGAAVFLATHFWGRR